MPSVSRINGLRVVIYPNDHKPAHVHVIGSGREASFYLYCPEGPPELRESKGFRAHELNPLLEKLMASLDEMCRSWRKIHGSFN